MNPVSYLDILNYDIARQIRRETADGDAIVEFLVKVMNGQQRPFVPKSQRITPANRMAAAKELLRRGFGDFSTTRPHLSESRDDYDTIHENISQRIREHTEYGSDITRFLLEVMAGVLHEDGFTMSHRVSAAQELLHRAYDINFDAVRWKDVEEYWRSQDDFDCAEETHSPLSTWERARVRATPNEGETNTPFPPRGKVRKGATHELLTTEKGEPAPSYPSCTSMSIPAGETKGIHNFAPDESAKDKNNYHFGPADPDPMVDSFYEPLSPEEQAAFDREMRLDTGGLLEDEGASSSRHSHADENPRQGGAGQSSLSCTSMSIPVSENPGGVGEEPAPAKAGGQSSSSCPSMSIPAGTLRRPNIRSP